MRHVDIAERRRRLLVRHHLAAPASAVEQVANDLVGLALERPGHGRAGGAGPPRSVRRRRHRGRAVRASHAAADVGHEAHDVRRATRPGGRPAGVMHERARAGGAAQAAVDAPRSRRGQGRRRLDRPARSRDAGSAGRARTPRGEPADEADSGPRTAIQGRRRQAVRGDHRRLDAPALPDVHAGLDRPHPPARNVDLQPVPLVSHGRLDRRTSRTRRVGRPGRGRGALVAGVRTGHARGPGVVDEVDEGRGSRRAATPIRPSR